MIEINRAGSLWIYRISPNDPCTIERRENRHGARWTWYARWDTADDAKQMLLQIEKESD